MSRVITVVRRWALRALAGSALVVSPAGAQVATSRTLSLAGAARLAGEQGAEPLAAKERAHQRAARVAQTRADQLPTLTTDALIDGGTNLVLSPGGSFPGGFWNPISDRGVDLRLRVTQRLLDLPGIRRWQVSASEAAAAWHAAQSTSDRASRDGAMDYLRLLRARGTVEARVADSALAAELVAISRQQLAAGVGIGLDVTRAESRLAQVESDLIGARSEGARAELELLRRVGLDLDTRLELSDSLREPTEDDLAVTIGGAERQALDRRPDLRAAAEDVVAADRQAKAVAAERVPTISAYASIASDGNGILGQKSYGIAFSLPVFDGFRRESRSSEARFRRREAELRARDAESRAKTEVRTALLELRADVERVAAATTRRRLAEQEVSEARERFRNGVASNADVIVASIALNQARDGVVDARARFHAARVELAYVRGTMESIR